ncbi:MAG: fructosamine kinase family protein [Bacteroidetes bacterium]|nr:fructosamine kinase family protein [Bacteroidota bacterium]
MANLFGSLPAEFYAAYENVRPLAPGYRTRFDIYNLYHLLNHLNLFGYSYLTQVHAILRRYG